MLLFGISPAQRQKLLTHLKIIVDHVGESSFHDLEKDDMEALVAWLYTRGTTETALTYYKEAIKQFWKWMQDGEEPTETQWIERARQSYRRIRPQKLLTPTDVEAMIAACSNDRDRAFMAILWETGARIGELIDRQVGDIETGAHGR